MKHQHSSQLSIYSRRRTVLKTGAASVGFSALPLLSACSSSSDGDDSAVDTGPDTSTSPNAGALKIGVTVPQSGAFADEGADQLRGIELAVQHLNGMGDGGMLNTMQPSSLQGNGVLGRPVEFVVADTETRSSVAASVATQLISEEGASVLIGGSSSGSAFAIQDVAQQLGAIYMSGMAHSNDVTGMLRSANSFRQYMNSNISSLALAKTLSGDLGTERSAYYLTSDFSWGDITGESIRQATEQLGWQTVNSLLWLKPLARTAREFMEP